MRFTLVAGLIISAVTTAGCGGGGMHINPEAKPVTNRWNATLATPEGLAGALQVTGTGWMGADPKKPTETQAYVSVANAGPGGRHPWHVHRGQCGQDQGILGPADAYPILKVGGDGKAEAEAKLEMPEPVQGQYFINVHASPANMATIVACGNLAPPSR
jgi:hypothetical protein